MNGLARKTAERPFRTQIGKACPLGRQGQHCLSGVYVGFEVARFEPRVIHSLSDYTMCSIRLADGAARGGTVIYCFFLQINIVIFKNSQLDPEHARATISMEPRAKR
jgi:hypothetical protein